MDKEISEREAFEAWATNEGAYPRATERAPDGGYLLMKTATDWNTWQAACKWQREKDAEICRHVDLHEGDRLKNSDPRITCADAILNQGSKE